MNIDWDLLSIQNPWWKRKEAGLKFDPVLRSLTGRQPVSRPEITNCFNHQDKGMICFLLGPRGAGLTSALKFKIKELLEKHIKPENIFYYSCANLGTYEQLNEVIKIFLDWKKDTPSVKYIFIDDISLIKNWPKGIGYLKDSGRLKNFYLIFAGSIFPERLNGLGKIEINTINTLDFLNFVYFLNPKLGRAVNKKNYFKLAHQLDYYLDIYFLTGGFLPALNSFKEHGGLNQKVYEEMISWLNIDIAKMGRDIFLLKQVMERLISHLGQPIGYKTIARKTKAKTHLTIAEYLNVLESMLIIKTVYQIGSSRESTSRKAKKVYFRDPFFFWLFYAYVYGSLDNWHFSRERLHKDEIFSALIENVVFSHLIKQSSGESRVTYLRDSVHNRETNFFIGHGKNIRPIFIRYNRAIKEGDEKMIKRFKKGIIITRDIFKINNRVKVLPLTYFLLFYQDFC